MLEEITNTCIRTAGLSVGYRRKGAENILFENLSLELRSGELVCFMGQNGAGKSTLIRTLSGLQIPLSGEIHYKTAVQTGEAASPLARELAVVLTDKITAVNMTVDDLIAFGRYPYIDWTVKLAAKDMDIVNQTLEEFRITHLRNKKIQELSDGQLQMVMIARAVVQDTSIILLDEPTAHLDLNNRLEIMNLLRRLAHELKKAILVSTHELDLALQTSDLIWLAGQNKDIITGIPEDLVLNGAFDAAFKFKGFNLKTGKILHEPHRGLTVKIVGQGHALLWTRNAFERKGYTVADVTAERTVTVDETEEKTRWTIENGMEFHSLQHLFQYLTNGK